MNYIKRKPMEKGICFICNTPCENYCHLKCAISYADEKDRRIKEAIRQEKENDILPYPKG